MQIVSELSILVRVSHVSQPRIGWPAPPRPSSQQALGKSYHRASQPTASLTPIARLVSHALPRPSASFLQCHPLRIYPSVTSLARQRYSPHITTKHPWPS
ncbi:hypothetical protein E2C01_085183 [Portunus trituberculatus]|uniref:Uncharacterized protein n=1 Tax=Portunus trituberculatus TaxID=210409 RepID=A0A5B7J633_PORTR|nr:hypothetical protein [Portunus trituberculatus]